MFRLSHQTIATQSLTRYFFRSLASFERFGQYKNDFSGERKPRKSKPKGKAKGSADENRRISNIFYRLLTKNNLKLERLEGSQFEITAKDLAVACREQHSLYIANEKFKLKKPITRFGSHNVDVDMGMIMNMIDSVVPLTVTVKKLTPGAEELSEKLQHNVEVDQEDSKSNERGPKILEAVKAV